MLTEKLLLLVFVSCPLLPVLEIGHRMSTTASTVSVGHYLFRRIRELGVEHIFGVPGDFNLRLSDEIYRVAGLNWLGTCNELNAAYAADGYTRIKDSPGVLITTYAGGELSAMNGVAGAYAEHAGMIHIVGMTLRTIQNNRVMVHHTMEPNMDHSAYIRMAAPIRKTYACLMEDSTMAEEIDRVVTEWAKSRLPVYIYVPTDVVEVQLDALRLKQPLDTSVRNEDVNTEASAVKMILQAIKFSQKPALLIDVLITRHGGQGLARKLAELTHFSSYTTSLSKGVIDETSPYVSCVLMYVLVRSTYSVGLRMLSPLRDSFCCNSFPWAPLSLWFQSLF